MLHVSELDHKRIEHPADVLKEGDELRFSSWVWIPRKKEYP